MTGLKLIPGRWEVISLWCIDLEVAWYGFTGLYGHHHPDFIFVRAERADISIGGEMKDCRYIEDGRKRSDVVWQEAISLHTEVDRERPYFQQGLAGQRRLFVFIDRIPTMCVYITIPTHRLRCPTGGLLTLLCVLRSCWRSVSEL